MTEIHACVIPLPLRVADVHVCDVRGQAPDSVPETLSIEEHTWRDEGDHNVCVAITLSLTVMTKYGARRFNKGREHDAKKWLVNNMTVWANLHVYVHVGIVQYES